MGLVGKIVCIISCAMGLTCTLAPIIQERGSYHDNVWNSECRASVACVFLCFFMVCAAIIILGVTLCCHTNDVIMGISIAVIAALCTFFSITSYATFKHGRCEFETSNQLRHPREKPSNGDWLFGSMVASISLLLNSMTLALISSE